MKILLLILLASGFQSVAIACEEGIKSYQETVYAKVRKDCAKCHDGKRPEAPAFATADTSKSYQHLLNYMNFSRIEDSLLVIRAGNGHCKEELCEFESGIEMAEKARLWWDSGEKTCERNGKYFSAELPIPKDIPKSEIDTARMTFDLSSLSKDLEGVSFQIEIQDFVETTQTNRGAYRVHSPRLINGKGAITVKNIKILLNGMHDSIANAYTGISKSMPFVPINNVEVESATPVLSPQSIILLKDGLKDPKLSVSFVDIQKSEQAECFGMNRFKKYMLPAFYRVRCDTCHNSEATEIGTRMISVDDSITDLCLSTSGLMNLDFPMTSALVAWPSKGLGKHPIINAPEQMEFTGAIKQWLTKGQE